MNTRRYCLKLIKPSILIYFTLIIFLIGCDDQNNKIKQAEIFIAKVQQTNGQKVEPLPQFTIPVLSQSTPTPQRSPFVPSLESQPQKPNISHIPNSLESFPLSQLHYVGILSQSNQIWGLISAPNGVIYNISIGQCIGQDNGKIIQITPQKIIIQETVTNELRGWVTRTKELPISKNNQQGSPS